MKKYLNNLLTIAQANQIRQYVWLYLPDYILDNKDMKLLSKSVEKYNKKDRIKLSKKNKELSLKVIQKILKDNSSLDEYKDQIEILWNVNWNMGYLAAIQHILFEKYEIIRSSADNRTLKELVDEYNRLMELTDIKSTGVNWWEVESE